MLGYSDGRLRDNDATFTSGGQCEDGLKMIIIIGEVEVPTSDGNKNHNLIESVIIIIASSTAIVNNLLRCINHNILSQDIHAHMQEKS